MKVELLYCKTCKIFTIKPACPKCNERIFSPKPGRYSPDDKWGSYRRQAKMEANPKV